MVDWIIWCLDSKKSAPRLFTASGEDPQCTTPKASRKNDMGHYGHPATAQSTVPSPGAASMNSMHEDYSEISSPKWSRTPASPVSTF